MLNDKTMEIKGGLNQGEFENFTVSITNREMEALIRRDRKKSKWWRWWSG